MTTRFDKRALGHPITDPTERPSLRAFQDEVESSRAKHLSALHQSPHDLADKLHGLDIDPRGDQPDPDGRTLRVSCSSRPPPPIEMMWGRESRRERTGRR